MTLMRFDLFRDLGGCYAVGCDDGIETFEATMCTTPRRCTKRVDAGLLRRPRPPATTSNPWSSRTTAPAGAASSTTARCSASSELPRHTAWFSGMVALYEGGFVVTGADAERFRDADVWREAHRSPLGLEASRPGVFAVGDVRHSLVKRVASALGEGAMAVRFVHEHLSQEA